MNQFIRTFGAVVLLGVLFACSSPTATPTALPLATSSKVARSESATPKPVNVSPTTASLVPTPADSNPTEPPAPEATAVVVEPTSPPSQPPPASAAPQDYFGVNTNGEIFYNENARAMAVLGGVQMVRTSVAWSTVEGKQGEFRWQGIDNSFKILRANNLTPLVLILDNPSWAANTPCGPVNDLAAFDSFMRTLVARYPDVHYWALYNEPDNAHYPEHPGGGCFGGQDLNSNGKPDFQDYAEELRVAWRAVHGSNPNARLVTGAVAFDNFDEASAPERYPGGGKGGTFNYHFLEQVFGYMQANPLPDGDKYFDLLGFNFYGIYGPYWERQVGGIGVSAKANKLKSLMNAAGISAPLLVSETGSNSGSVGDQVQSEFAVKTLTRGLASGIAHVIWWSFQDASDSDPPPVNTWKYGLIDQHQKAKASFTAYQTTAHELMGATFTGPLQVEGGEGYLFTVDKANKAVVWSASDQTVTIAFSGKAIQVTDMSGVARVVQDNSGDDKDGAEGRIAVAVGTSPLFIELLNP